MGDQFSRTKLLLGNEGQRKLQNASVAVFGLGGVGSWCAEALARSGVGRITLIDDDVVDVTNMNRQLVALHSTIGMRKTQVIRDRIADISPGCQVTAYDIFYTAETEGLIDITGFSHIADAVDTISAKVLLAQRAECLSVPIVSAMGTGNKLHPAKLEVADIYDTDVCPLARIMRRELRKRGVKKLKVVYSREPPLTPGQSERSAPAEPDKAARSGRRALRPLPGSVSFVPPAAGMIMAGEVVRHIVRIG